MSDAIVETLESPELSPAAVVLRKEVNAVVAEKSKTEVRQRVVDTLVEAELSRRANALAGALTKRADAAKELSKIEPDQVAFGEDGKKLSATYSSKAALARKQAKEKLDKIDRAIDAAINNADYQSLEKIGGGKENATPPPSDE